MKPDQLERWKMCMAEAGFPQPTASLGPLYTTVLEDEYEVTLLSADCPGGSHAFWTAVWNASRLVGDRALAGWCQAHYVDALLRQGDPMPDYCECNQ